MHDRRQAISMLLALKEIDRKYESVFIETPDSETLGSRSEEMALAKAGLYRLLWHEFFR